MSNKINSNKHLLDSSRLNLHGKQIQSRANASGILAHAQQDNVNIAKALQQDQATLTVSLRNLNDGFNAINIADDTLKSVSHILSRMQELAEQSLYGTFSLTQRSALSNEFVALGSEIQRLSIATTFHGTELVHGGTLIAEVDKKQLTITHQLYSGVSVALDALGLAYQGSAALSFSINANSIEFAQSASAHALDAITSALVSVGNERGLLLDAKTKLAEAIGELKDLRPHRSHHAHHAHHQHAAQRLEPEVIVTDLKSHIKHSHHQAHAAQAAGLDPERAKLLLEDD